MIKALLAWITSLFILVSGGQAPTASLPRVTAPAVQIVASDLEIPWSIAFLPDGTALVTERPGRLNLLDEANRIVKISSISEVLPIGEGGLLGVVVDPNYSSNKNIYLYYTYRSDGDRTLNRVVRYKFDKNSLSEATTLIDTIPGASNHNGGRLKFGPDGYLYITTGDAQEPSQAQDKNSLAGKILRWKDNQVEIYSSGHRNPQGLAWDSSGQLWETEHGPTAHDEINKITQGYNYGWPLIIGNQTREGMVTPIRQSGTDTWAPSGLAYYQGALYFAGLKGQALYKFDSHSSESEELFKNQFGRIRDVEVGPDNQLYLLTSNRDGRGTVRSGDDKIIKINSPSIAK